MHILSSISFVEAGTNKLGPAEVFQHNKTERLKSAPRLRLKMFKVSVDSFDTG